MAAPIAPSILPTPMRSSSNGSTCIICPRRRCRKAIVDGYPRQIWWNADGETIVESYTITDMAHGTPLGIADNDEHYGAQGAFLIEAGISSSYHIANFFGLTEWIHQPKEASKEISKQTSKPAGVASADADAGYRRGALAAGDAAIASPEPPASAARRAIDVGAVITRALTAAGLMK